MANTFTSKTRVPGWRVRILVVLFMTWFAEAKAEPDRSADVFVYGGTPAGVAAAVAAARNGRQVIIAEPQYFVGGMMAGGLTKTDLGNRTTIGGISKEFFGRVLDYYKKTYGESSVQVKETHE